MKFNEIKKNIELFLDDPKIISKEQSEKIREAFNIIATDFHIMFDGDKVEKNQKSISDVTNSIILVNSVILDGPITDKFSSFVLSFAEAIYNWNNNIYKDEILRHFALYMSRTVQSRNTMIKSINMIKENSQRMMDLTSWLPPAYEISKAYFEELLEQNEKGKE